MNHRPWKAAWTAIALVVLASSGAWADAGSKSFKAAPAIVSPDVGQTWPQGNLLGWSFRLGTDRRSLTVVATYGNDLIADRNNPQTREDHWFRFPDVVYRPERHAFVWSAAQGRGGSPVVVAWRAGSSTALARNALVLLFNHGGKLAAAIKVAPPGTVFTTSLTQVAGAPRWSLQGLIQH